MDDLISRQNAINAFYEPKNGGTYAEFDDGSEWYMTSKQIYAVLESLPSAEPKTGKWNRLSNNTFHCKSCGCTFIVMQGNDAMNYCPNCGSYNGGEEE